MITGALRCQVGRVLGGLDLKGIAFGMDWGHRSATSQLRNKKKNSVFWYLCATVSESTYLLSTDSDMIHKSSKTRFCYNNIYICSRQTWHVSAIIQSLSIISRC